MTNPALGRQAHPGRHQARLQEYLLIGWQSGPATCARRPDRPDKSCAGPPPILKRSAAAEAREAIAASSGWKRYEGSQTLTRVAAGEMRFPLVGE